MELVTTVRRTMKELINAGKNLKTSRDVDVFTQIAFDYNLSVITYGDNRKSGTFAIQYLVSPKPDSTNTAPVITYDQIITKFESEKAQAFKDAGLILLSCSYEQSDIVTDHQGSVSLSFTINITVTERSR